MATTEARARLAKHAAFEMARQGREAKDAALLAIADELERQAPAIAAANALDVADAKGAGLAEPLVKRLAMGEAKARAAAAGVRSVAALEDPCGVTLLDRAISPSMRLRRVSCPIGLVGVVFESRPDALVQISSLCLKSGNAAILKGGREALRTNRALCSAITKATATGTDAGGRAEGGIAGRRVHGGAALGGLPAEWLTLLETRDEVSDMLKLDGIIDLLVPRGSNEFVRHIMDNTRIPVLGHADGICHIYVSRHADPGMAARVAADAKTQYPAACNAVETLLVDPDAAEAFLPALAEEFAEFARQGRPITMRGCARAAAVIPMELADESDWTAEYLGDTLAIKIAGFDDAVAHINHFGSHHTDAIITGSDEEAAEFIARVDSANVFRNCSTRFSDGFRYGFGAEVGIATGKMHPRGPVGLEGMVTYKYLLEGDGDVVADYELGKKRFSHA